MTHSGAMCFSGPTDFVWWIEPSSTHRDNPVKSSANQFVLFLFGWWYEPKSLINGSPWAFSWKEMWKVSQISFLPVSLIFCLSCALRGCFEVPGLDGWFFLCANAAFRKQCLSTEAKVHSKNRIPAFSGSGQGFHLGNTLHLPRCKKKNEKREMSQQKQEQQTRKDFEPVTNASGSAVIPYNWTTFRCLLTFLKISASFLNSRFCLSTKFFSCFTATSTPRQMPLVFGQSKKEESTAMNCKKEKKGFTWRRFQRFLVRVLDSK